MRTGSPPSRSSRAASSLCSRRSPPPRTTERALSGWRCAGTASCGAPATRHPLAATDSMAPQRGRGPATARAACASPLPHCIGRLMRPRGGGGRAGAATPRLRRQPRPSPPPMARHAWLLVVQHGPTATRRRAVPAAGWGGVRTAAGEARAAGAPSHPYYTCSFRTVLRTHTHSNTC